MGMVKTFLQSVVQLLYIVNVINTYKEFERKQAV